MESFVCVGLEQAQADPLALDLIDIHRTDEARHTTTSLDLGEAFYRRATPDSRRIVDDQVKLLVYSLIRKVFALCGVRSKLHSIQNGNFLNARFGLESALLHPLFADFPLKTVDELLRFWEEQGIVMPETEEYRSSMRWVAQQIRRLCDRLELRLEAPGREFERYQESLAA